MLHIKSMGRSGIGRMITDKCGMLNNLLPGDVVLADRGFDIAESTALYCAKVEIPAFTKGRKQF